MIYDENKFLKYFNTIIILEYLKKYSIHFFSKDFKKYFNKEEYRNGEMDNKTGEN